MHHLVAIDGLPADIMYVSRAQLVYLDEEPIQNGENYIFSPLLQLSTPVMAEITKTFEFDAPVEETWDFIITPETVAPCVPGCESYEQHDEDVFTAKIDVKVAYTSLTFDADVEITDKEPQDSATVEVLAKPSGRMPGSAKASGDLAMAATAGGGTEGTITIDFAIRGRLGSLGESAFKSKTEQMTEQFLENVREGLEVQEATTK